MSYVAKKGRQAAESANEEKADVSQVLRSLKSGSSFKVRVPSTEDFVEYFAHGVFGKFYTTPCTKPGGEEDYYDKAVDHLYTKVNEEEDEDKKQVLRDQAYQLKAKPRYLFGFINLEDGLPLIVDLTKNQAKSVISAIDKYTKKIGTFPFELSKEGMKMATKVSLTPVIDEDDLTEQERKHFESTAGKAFDDLLYEKVLKVRKEEEQIEDLKAFGFDVRKLGVEDEVTPIEDEGQGDNGDDNYPF
ncbi:hypothetical protein [Mechercharimyces sp. CAU 1602]|uniref:hypothetical protein n=1 Tax=Mechercharimyces sp. CAU 1602 TaxID=2973933 RepID=UPI00216333BD|nr:hypothetical protein [Mechercharimyces sp. CAU 1602]MCS1350353.1 hypothetical protein [Mechercharimyces sp. CAU 1602]